MNIIFLQITGKEPELRHVSNQHRVLQLVFPVFGDYIQFGLHRPGQGGGTHPVSFIVQGYAMFARSCNTYGIAVRVGQIV